MLLLLLACTSPSEEALSPLRAALAQPPKAPPSLTAHLDSTEIPPDFHVSVHAPFLVLGDMPQAEVDQLTQRLVVWADRALRAELFEEGPEPWLNVWLYADDASYTKHVTAHFGEAPSTPYGFATEDGLFMNIATGGGTLIHELVHPFVDADMPGAAPWINEGLGSLYEASAERDGRIVGLLNWRLPGLQEAIAAGPLLSFEELASLDPEGFYADETGVFYAQSRYLLYYLQEEGKLVPFYRQARADFAEDPTGYKALVATLGEDDMAAFQSRWQAWVMTLEWSR